MRRAGTRAAFLALGCLSLFVAATTVWVLRNERVGGCRDLGPIGALPENSVSTSACAHVYIVHGAGDDYSVFLAETPHLPGEPLEWKARRRLFVSPFHGETFTLDGRAIGGPATHGLWLCPFTVSLGHLVIDVPKESDLAAIRTACMTNYVP
jgi:hypothetical protein